jgi:hypothetical protein
MNCATCSDVGIVCLNFQEGDEYGLCLCPAGERMRRVVNEGHRTTPLWQVWCAREQVDQARVHPIEDVLTPEELAKRGFRELTAATAIDAIVAAARHRSEKR